jgi:hypothetical protein
MAAACEPAFTRANSAASEGSGTTGRWQRIYVDQPERFAVSILDWLASAEGDTTRTETR